MSSKSSTGFVAGLIVEGAVIGLVVTLLPKLPLGQSQAAPRDAIADQRPNLTPPLPMPELLPALSQPGPNWRTAVSRPVALAAALPPPDPAYVERRLDQAGQQLLSGMTTYLSRQAQEVLHVEPDSRTSEIRFAPVPSSIAPPSYTAPSFTPPANAFRY